MRLLFVADGRSPTALSWLRHWIETGCETHLVSTFPCHPPPGLASFHVMPAAFGSLGGGRATKPAGRLPGRARALLRPLRYLLGPLSLPPHRERFRALAAALRPDLVHALRLPFEGMLAAAAPAQIPLVVSIWGNDLTLHAGGSPLMAWWTRHTLRRVDGLLADARRDIHLGHRWGLHQNAPVLVVPGGGGVRLDELEAAGRGSGQFPEELPQGDLVINPRGQRPGSLRQDVFFQAIPMVLEKIPGAYFVCPPLAGDAEAERWVETLGIGARVRLWPRLEQAQLWSLMHRAQVFVSPSLHDGTPNSLLEAMACGCFPVVGNVESLREWVRDGENGLLVDATSPQALADGMLTALQSPDLRETARKQNARLIAKRAEYGRCMATAEAFYREMIARRG